MTNKHIGSHFDDFLADEGVLDEVTAVAIKRVLAAQTSYKQALAEVSRLVDLDPAAGTPEGDKLQVLTSLVEAYEAAQYPTQP